MNKNEFEDVLAMVDHSMSIEDGKAVIRDASRLRASIHRLAEENALGSGRKQGLARYAIRLAAHAAGVYPASINDLYMARGRGDVPATFTVPAMNLRSLSFDAGRAAFRAANRIEAGALIFEIARSEMGYTDQRPVEYASNILAAAIAENYRGPVFIQGDHFQVSAKRYNSDPETELQTIRDLVIESTAAGFYNIDIDTSTLVDINLPTVNEQQALNARLTAMFTAFIRSVEKRISSSGGRPVTISVGGEIGEVGGTNSTPGELRAYMEAFNTELREQAPGEAGLSKISIQTGTSHGGVVLPDGSIADVAVDFDTLLQLSRIARQEYHMGGAVQHGASTLPESAFSKFVEAEAVEVHLATNFMNMLYDRMPDELRTEIYAYLDQNYASDRKPNMTDGQFYYKTRKNAIGPFKRETWQMGTAKREEVSAAWEEQFSKLFTLLGLEGTRQYVEQTIKPVDVRPDLKTFLGGEAAGEDVSDLAD